MRVPWNRETLPALRARYAAAVVDVCDHHAVAGGEQPPPGEQPPHIFDGPDGLRLIISRERLGDGRTGIHLSASVVPETVLHQRLMKRELDPNDFGVIVRVRWQEIAHSDRTPELLEFRTRRGFRISSSRTHSDGKAWMPERDGWATRTGKDDFAQRRNITMNVPKGTLS